MRLDEEIRRDEEESQKHASKELLKSARSGLYSRAQGADYDISYHITETNVGFEDILDELDGINSKVLTKEYGKDGSKSAGYIGDHDTDLRRYMEWFFLPEEVFDVREIDVMRMKHRRGTMSTGLQVTPALRKIRLSLVR